MLRNKQILWGKRAHALPWAIAFIGLLGLSTLVYGFYIAGEERVGGVETVAKPSAGAVGLPSLADAAEDTTVEVSVREPSPVECKNLLLMVGDSHTLTSDYVPPNLVYLNDYGIPARGMEDMLRQEVAVQLARLISAAAADGVEVLAASGYRSYWEQKGTFAWFENTYGEDAVKLSAPPGESEHQLGTAVDFASSEAGYELVSTFSETSAGIWLARHAAEYGFILSYKKDQKTDTGVGYEPWHYRFVGVENARKIKAAEERPTSFYLKGKPYCYMP